MSNICILSEFFANEFVEGTQRVVLELSKALISKGHVVVVLAPMWESDAKLKSTSTYVNGIKVHKFNCPSVSNPLSRTLFYIWNAFKLHREYNFDIFYGTYTLPPALATIILGTLLKKRKVVALYEPAACKKAEKVKFLKWLPKADIYLTHTKTVKNMIVDGLAVPEKRISVIPGFCDLKLFRPGNKDRAIVKKYDLEGKFVVLCVGRVSSLKGIPYIIKAIKDLPVVLMLVGREPKHESFREMVKELGIKDKVKFIGYVKSYDDLPKYYSVADCFVLPSLSEGFGIVVAEAMANGLPVITSDTEPLPEVVGDAGIVVPARDVLKLSEAIKSLMEDKAMRIQLAKKSQERSKIFERERVLDLHVRAVVSQ